MTSKTPAPPKRTKKPRPRILSQSRVKAIIHHQGLRAGTDIYNMLEADMQVLIARACQRCRENGRSTVHLKDL